MKFLGLMFPHIYVGNKKIFIERDPPAINQLLGQATG